MTLKSEVSMGMIAAGQQVLRQARRWAAVAPSRLTDDEIDANLVSRIFEEMESARIRMSPEEAPERLWNELGQLEVRAWGYRCPQSDDRKSLSDGVWKYLECPECGQEDGWWHAWWGGKHLGSCDVRAGAIQLMNEERVRLFEAERAETLADAKALKRSLDTQLSEPQ